MRINKLATPLMLNSISQTIINLCDQAMIGRTYLEGFAAVSIIGRNIYCITGVLGAISVALNIIGSRAKGREDENDLNSSLSFSILISIITGVIFTTLCIIGGRNLLSELFLIKGKALNDGVIYLNIFSASLGLNLQIFNLSSYFKILNKTKYIFYGNLISCLSNLILDYILIFGKLGFPKLGITGNAIGSTLSLVLCLIYYITIIKKYKLINGNVIKKFIIKIDIIKVSVPLVLEEFMESTIFVFLMNYILSQLGLLYVSTYNLLLNIIDVALMPMYAYSQACITVVNEDIGATRNINIYSVILLSIKRAMIFYISIGVLLIAFKDYIPILITNEKALIISSSKFLLPLILVNIFNIPSYILKSSIQSLGREKRVFMYTSVFTMISISLSYLLAIVLEYGLIGIYMASLVNYLLLAIAMIKEYKDFNIQEIT